MSPCLMFIADIFNQLICEEAFLFGDKFVNYIYIFSHFYLEKASLLVISNTLLLLF